MERKKRGDDEYEPEMPRVYGAGYLIGHLWEVGPTAPDGGPITHQEIGKWMELIGVELEPWEVRFLRRLSGEYGSESRRAEKPECPAPVRMLSRSDTDLAGVARNMQQALRELSKL